MFVELPYDPAVSLLNIYPEKTIMPKDTFTPMFTAALFAIARTWEQTKCQLTDEWIKKVWYYIQSILLSHKKEQYCAICRDMDGPRDCHTE